LENGQLLAGSAGKTLIVGNTNFAVDGGQLVSSNLVNQGTIAINKGSVTTSGQFVNEAQGSVVIQNLGQSNFQGGVVNNGNFQLASAAAKSSGGTFTNNGNLSGRGKLAHQLINNGFVSVNMGEHLINDNGVNTSVNNNQIQMTGGRLDVTGKLTNSAGAFITGHGTLETSKANPGAVGLFNSGLVGTSGGALNIYGDVINQGNGSFITSGNSTTTFWDDVEHNGTEIRTSSGSSTVFFGSVTGAGAYTGTGSVFFEGDLKPGNSPADVLFEGDLYFGSTAKLGIEIGGLLPGDEYDRLTVFGDIWLGGILEVSLINSFNPTFGDSFTVIKNQGNNPLYGQFFGLNQGESIWAGNQEFFVDYFGGSGRDLVLTAVPEPCTTIVLGLASWILMLQRRRCILHHE
jgi:hypothetical protein